MSGGKFNIPINDARKPYLEANAGILVDRNGTLDAVSRTYSVVNIWILRMCTHFGSLGNWGLICVLWVFLKSPLVTLVNRWFSLLWLSDQFDERRKGLYFGTKH